VYTSPLLADLPVERHESHPDGLIDGQPLTTSERLAREGVAYLHSSRLARRVGALRARLNPEATEFDGIVGPHPSLAPPGKVWSITAVERQAACGLGYFGQYARPQRRDRSCGNPVDRPMQRQPRAPCSRPWPPSGWLDEDRRPACCRATIHRDARTGDRVLDQLPPTSAASTDSDTKPLGRGTAHIPVTRGARRRHVKARHRWPENTAAGVEPVVLPSARSIAST
jgi:hypothetical protein